MIDYKAAYEFMRDAFMKEHHRAETLQADSVFQAPAAKLPFTPDLIRLTKSQRVALAKREVKRRRKA